ncbi:MAG: VWA domain-containing protein, partial [Candidatus Acidiferrales bacterium]
MNYRRLALFALLTVVFLVVGSFGEHLLARQSSQSSTAQQSDQTVTQLPTIKSEARAVRVDVIVTDKKGNYIHDLKAEEFKVYEDNKQQAIVNFSFGVNPDAPASAQRRYLVLFFDNSTMAFSDQPYARTAAAKFIDQNAGPDRVMAVVQFGGSIKIVQNFTADPVRLKKVVEQIGTSAVHSNAETSTIGPGVNGDPSVGLSSSGADLLDARTMEFGAQSLLLAIRNMAQSLATIPGRKSMILFTSGFAVSPERQSELTATIDVCNKANVAVYPLDVRGITTPISMVPANSPDGSSFASNRAAIQDEALQSAAPRLLLASYQPSLPNEAMYFQHGGGGGGHGGGGSGGGGTGGGGTGGGGT